MLLTNLIPEKSIASDIEILIEKYNASRAADHGGTIVG
jgi:hypothetical protein